jgi:hypothetical protein
METKHHLKEEIEIYKSSIERLHTLICEANKKDNPNLKEILNYSQTKKGFEELLESAEKELQNCYTSQVDVDVKKIRDEFNKKNNSYAIIRNSYIKSVDN